MRIKGSRLAGPIILLIVTKFIISCTAESCLEETTAFLNASFYKADSYKPSAPDSITVFGIGKETDKLYSKSLNPLTIKLPLDASAESCGFVLKINGRTDTLNFIYSNYPHLISKECGITFFFVLDTIHISGSVINSVKIINNNITTYSGENIRILY
jgi:hypothetical protein